MKEYVNHLEIPIIIILCLSIIQSILAIFWESFSFMGQIEISTNLYFLKYNLMNPIFIIDFFELIVVLCSGFYLAKKKFKLRNNVIAGILLFLSSLLIFFFIPIVLPSVQLVFRLISIGLIFLINLVFFVVASVIGGIIGKFFWD